jgi:hypothetical protein
VPGPPSEIPLPTIETPEWVITGVKLDNKSTDEPEAGGGIVTTMGIFPSDWGTAPIITDWLFSNPSKEKACISLELALSVKTVTRYSLVASVSAYTV